MRQIKSTKLIAGRTYKEIRLPPRNFDLIDNDLIEQIKNSKNYFEFCELNGYNPNIKEHPLK